MKIAPERLLEVGDTIGLNGRDEEFRVVSLDGDDLWVVPSHRPYNAPIKVPRSVVLWKTIYPTNIEETADDAG